jgi:hypothetical protein
MIDLGFGPACGPPFDDLARSGHRNRGDREEGDDGAHVALGLLAQPRSERAGRGGLRSFDQVTVSQGRASAPRTGFPAFNHKVLEDRDRR